MIKIICDDEKIIATVGDKELAGFHGTIQCNGNKELVEFQLAMVLLQLIKSSPELVENALEKAYESLNNE